VYFRIPEIGKIEKENRPTQRIRNQIDFRVINSARSEKTLSCQGKYCLTYSLVLMQVTKKGVHKIKTVSRSVMFEIYRAYVVSEEAVSI
jgi:hypothetical protein